MAAACAAFSGLVILPDAANCRRHYGQDHQTYYQSSHYAFAIPFACTLLLFSFGIGRNSR